MLRIFFILPIQIRPVTNYNLEAFLLPIIIDDDPEDSNIVLQNVSKKKFYLVLFVRFFLNSDLKV